MMSPRTLNRFGWGAAPSVRKRVGGERVGARALAMLTIAMFVITSMPSLVSAQAPEKKRSDLLKPRDARLPGAQRRDRAQRRERTKNDRKVSALAVDAARQKAAQSEGPKPVIACEEPVHDFGTTWTGPALKHTFIIQNAGDKPLKITRVKPSCGCTIAGPYPRSIAPGESGEFPFSINTKKIRSRFDKSINVESNDPVTPRLRLRLRGEVKQYVDVVPSNAHFGTIFGNDIQERVLNITNNTDDPLEVTLGKPSSDDFDYKLVEKVPGKTFALHVVAEPPFEPGRLQSVVQLETNVEEQKQLTVYARGTVPERIDVRPESILVTNPRTPQTRGLSRVIRITNYGEKPVKVLDATVDDPVVKLTLSERTPGKAYTVLVQMPPGYQPPGAGRNITITLDDEKKPSVQVPIYSQQARRMARQQQARKRPAEQMVGEPAPQFSITTVAGKSLATSDLKDNVTVLNFFAPNCGFCKKQIPRLETIRQKYEDKGVRFINVSQKMRKEYPKDDVVNIINGLGFKGELAINHNNSMGRMFKATSFPTMVVIGKKGKVDAVNVGNIGDLETRLGAQLDALLAGKPVPSDEEIAKAAPDKPQRQAKRPKPARPTDLVGKPAPSFETKTIDGKELSKDTLDKYAATVLNFFAPNCGYCKKQIPRLETVRKKYEDKPVRFVNVSQKMRKEYPKDEVVEIINGLGFEGELAIDHSNTIGGAFNARGFPTMVVVGKSGKVEAVNVGNIGDLESRLGEQLDTLIAGKSVADAKGEQKDKPAQPTVKAAKKPTPKPTPSNKPQEVAPGKPAPKFETETIDGKKVSNDELDDYQATVLNFFAPNCPHCKRQIPRVEEIRKKYADKKVRFVNVSQKMRKEYPKDEVVELVNGLGFKGELAIDHTNTIGGMFNARGFPTMVVVGKDGNVAAINVGNARDLEERLGAQLDALVAGKPIPEKYAQAPRRRSRRRPAEDLKGKEAPAFQIETVDGKDVSSEDFAKHPATVLNFVAANCGFCKRQVPTVEQVRKEYESKGVRFVNIAQTMRKEYSVDEIVDIFHKQLDTKLEIAKDGKNEIGGKYKAVSFPTLFVVDKSGKVADVIIGAKPNLDKLLKSQLQRLVDGKSGA